MNVGRVQNKHRQEVFHSKNKKSAPSCGLKTSTRTTQQLAAVVPADYYYCYAAFLFHHSHLLSFLLFLSDTLTVDFLFPGAFY